MSVSVARRSSALFNLTRCAVLGAMAAILFTIEIPVVAFYKLDLSTLPAILAGFAMGPLQGLAVLAVKDVVHLLITSSSGVGELADFLMGLAFVLPASMIYMRMKSRKGAIISMIVGTLLMTLAAVLVNYFILIPAYQVLMGLSLEAIIGMGQAVFAFIDNIILLVLCITAPFNLLKGVVLSIVTVLLYKRISPLLHQRA